MSVEISIKQSAGVIADSCREILRLELDGSLLINPDELEAAVSCLSETLKRLEGIRSRLSVGGQG